jgi:hypothetical protein
VPLDHSHHPWSGSVRPLSAHRRELTSTAMSTHHHEYGLSASLASGIEADYLGFPSSHSTNSVSIALYFAQWLIEERDSAGMTVVVSGLICKPSTRPHLPLADSQFWRYMCSASSAEGYTRECTRWVCLYGLRGRIPTNHQLTLPVDHY